MIIVCTAPNLVGWAVKVDRETDLWFEADYEHDEALAIAIYPKTVWVQPDEVTIENL